MSGDANGLDVDLDAALAGSSDGGVPAGRALSSYAELANRLVARPASADEQELELARNEVRRAVGQAGTVEAAATVAIFNGLVRAADGTGIQLDEGVFAASSDFRDRLGLDGYGGAANTIAAADRRAGTGIGPGARGEERPVSVDSLFGD